MEPDPEEGWSMTRGDNHYVMIALVSIPVAIVATIISVRISGSIGAFDAFALAMAAVSITILIMNRRRRPRNRN